MGRRTSNTWRNWVHGELQRQHEKIFESSFFVECISEWDGTGELGFWKSLRLVVKNQPAGWNPRCPSLAIPQMFLSFVGETVSQERGAQTLTLLFTALGTELQRTFGVCGFLRSRKAVVTLGIEGQKAPRQRQWVDLIIGEEHAENPDEMRALASTAARRLLNPAPTRILYRI